MISSENYQIKKLIQRAILVLMALCLAACDSSKTGAGQTTAGDAEFSYAGKTITVVIGLDASAGGTTLGRLFAKHLEQNLPGNPAVIVNNMPGASTLNAHLHVLLKAPKDGTTVYYGPRSSLGELLKLPGFTFKYSDFTPLGGVQVAGLVVYARNDALPSGVNSAEDVVGKAPLNFGGMTSGHGRMIISTMALDLIGANYNYIAGYAGSGSIRAAVISGEVGAATDAAHAYLNQVAPVLVDTGKALPLFSMPVMNENGDLGQNTLVPDVPSVPVLYETLKGEAPSGIAWDAFVTMLELDQTMSHVFLGPPGMNSQPSEIFREGLEKALTSAAYFEEAQKVLSYAPEHVAYERQAEIQGATENVSDEVLSFIRAHIKKLDGN